MTTPDRLDAAPSTASRFRILAHLFTSTGRALLPRGAAGPHPQKGGRA